MEFNTIRVERDEGISILTMNRPDKLNALNQEIINEMVTVIDEYKGDDTLKVLIITGTGRAFCSGADLTLPIRTTDPRQPNINRSTRLNPFVVSGKLVKRLRSFHKPIIAAINGFAVGAGLSIACLCDLRIASENASFGAVFVKRGLVADTGISYFLPRLVGIERALELMWTGDIINANEAERIGLIGKVVPDTGLMSTTMALARKIAEGPSTSIELMKRMVYEGIEANNFSSQLTHEAWAQEMCYKTDDYAEGINAFRAKRPPTFTGK